MIKCLIIEGFKSFADKTVIEFSKGMTAVIGPNGSGKSNVTDAIRWVLGEESAKSLRGGKMEDVIFSGSENRSPMQQASVTIIIDNSNEMFPDSFGVEIRVQRVLRTTKSSKISEFFINDQSCRLKDIHNLFLDSGIGSDSYSMIGQGEVQKIISADKEERRSIFEEAAGIVKLKNQKHRALKKMKETEQVLLRLSDILKALNDQLTPLKKQSEKAKQYKEYEESLRSIEMDFYIREYTQLNEKLLEIQSEHKQAENELNELIAELDTTSELFGIKKTENENLQEELFNLQSQVTAKTKQVEESHSNLRLLLQKLSHTQEKKEQFQQQLQSFEEKYSLSSDDVIGKQEELKTLSKSIEALNNDIYSTVQQISKSESNLSMIQIRHDQKKEETISVYNDLSIQQERKETYEQERQKLWMHIESLEKKQKEIAKEQLEIRTEGELLSSNHSKTISELEDAVMDEANLNQEREILTSDLQSLIEEYKQVDIKLMRVTSEKEQLERIVLNHEGYYEGVKHVLNQGDKSLKGILGSVASIIQMPETYEKAIEELLQGSMQHIVTETEEDAKKAVRWLETQQKGRATFLPLNLAKQQNFSPSEQQAIQSEPALKYALDAVTFEPKFKPIMQMLMGRCLIADDLDSAINFVKSNRFHLKIATTEGQVVQASSISGGRSKSKNHLFSQRRRLKSLQEEAALLESTFNKLTITINSKKNTLSIKTKEHEEQQQKLMNLKEQQQTLHTQLAVWEQKEQRTNDSLEVLAMEEQDKRVEWNGISEKIDSLRQVIQTNQFRHSKLQEELDTCSLKLQEEGKNTQDLLEKKTQVLMELSRLQEEEKQTEIALSHFGNQSDEVKIQLEYLVSEQTRLSVEEEKLQTEVKEAEEQNTEEQNALQVYEAEVEKLRESIQAHNIDLSETEEHLAVLRENKSTKEKQVHSLEVSMSKRETQMEQVVTVLTETYELDINSIEKRSPLSPEEHKKNKAEMSSLKSKMQSLGTVNPLAPDEYEELLSRYEEQKAQQDDMEQAEKDLKVLLQDVHNEMLKRFTTSFEQISDNFSKMFSDFFGGGKGKLSLLDPKNPLESPIDIVAQPPGKKLTNINLLSGGEKSLVAIVIVFSILTAKPSPFVILDEIDAPLDEANILRFSRYLRKFAHQSQFIIITHRKNTMMVVDNVYGVTQQNPGVSILFPLTLEDLDEKYVV
ncbi:chromosome segregation protein SMC [Bacillus bombysepticus]|uniref:chromosome segregation protein SMC n=1 Tax=Bacillus bombysepticus TaxID=658666 RepID=UPI0030163BFA